MQKPSMQSLEKQIELISFSLSLKDFDKAISLLFEASEQFYLYHYSDKFLSFLAKIPEDKIYSDAEFLLKKAVALSQTSTKFDLIESYLTRAEFLFTQANDLTNVIVSKLQLGYVYFLNSKYVQSFGLLSQIDTSSLSDKTKAKHNHYLALANFGMDEFAKSAETAEIAIQQYTKLNEIEYLPRLYRHCSYPLNYLENFEKSLRYQKKGLKIAMDLEFGEQAIAWGNYEIAKTYIRLGRFDEADSCLSLAEKIFASAPNSLISNYVHRARNDWMFAQNQLLDKDSVRSLIDDNQPASHSLDVLDALDLFITQSEHKNKTYELAKSAWQDYKHIESIVDLAHFHVEVGLAALGIGQTQEALQHLEKAERDFSRYECNSKLTSTNFYLSKVHALLGNKTRCNFYLKKALDALAAQERFNLDWWQSWVVAEMCAFALKEGIQIDFVERWMLRRLRDEDLHFFYPLISHLDAHTREIVTRLMQRSSNTLPLEARKMIIVSKADAPTKARLIEWLDSGWLTPLGFIHLKQIFGTERRVEIFLLWICPRMQGSKKLIGQELKLEIKQTTIKSHIEDFLEILRDHPDTKNKNINNYTLAMQWAAHRKYIDISQSIC